ncbi:hypothetical protein [Sporisorium scitamineum]|nr:hypothetical protein [Sporisorium scitamineum]
MLACVYIALESSMYVARQSELLAPLFGDVGLVGLLARSGVLVEDVRVHLETIEAHTGAELVEFVQVAREEHGYFSQGATVEEDVEDSSARRELFRLVQECLPSAAQLTPKWKSAGLTEEHIDLLRPAQVRSTLAYVSRLTTLAHSTSSNLLLAHAYTRYLGDLSGGQHIVKKVSKRFPCTNNAQGFAFYTFDTSTDLLKTRFRNAMEQSSSSSDSTLVDALVQEANTAFDLNTGLFESLLPATLRMNKEEVEKVDGVQAGKVQQAVVDMWTADKVVSVAGAVVFAVTTAVWVRHLLTGSAGVVGVHA